MLTEVTKRVLAGCSLKAPLFPAEQKLLSACELGSRVDVREELPKHRGVRSSMFRWVLANELDAGKFRRGFCLLGVRFIGVVELDDLALDFALALQECELSEGMTLNEATARGLSLSGSTVTTLTMTRAHIRGDVELTNGFRANQVGLERATIDGALLGQACRVFAPYSMQAILARGLRIDGDLHLDEASIRGVVDLRELQASSNVSFDKARLRGWRFSPQRWALLLGGADIRGSLSLRGIRCAGAIEMRGTKVANNLWLTNAAISNRGQRGIDGGWVKIGGGLMLDDFRTNSQIWLPLTTVAAQIRCTGLRITGDGSGGLYLPDSTCGQSLTLAPAQLGANTVVNLDGVTCQTLRFDSNGVSRTAQLHIVHFRYAAIEVMNGSDKALALRELVSRHGGHFTTEPYVQAARVLAQIGREEDAYSFLFEREKLRLRYGHLNFRGQLWGYLYRAVAGFGYFPGRALWWALAFVAAGAFIFDVHSEHFAYAKAFEAKDGMAAQAKQIKPPKFNPIIFSLDSFLPIIDLDHAEQFAADDHPLCEFKPGNEIMSNICAMTSLRGYYWFHVAMGWLMATILAAAVSRLARRELTR